MATNFAVVVLQFIAYVINPEGPDGSSILSIDRARGEQGWRILEKSMEVDETVKGKIIGSNRGGAASRRCS